MSITRRKYGFSISLNLKLSLRFKSTGARKERVSRFLLSAYFTKNLKQKNIFGPETKPDLKTWTNLFSHGPSYGI